MKKRFRPVHIVIAAVNAAAVAGVLILTAMGNSAARSQRYNYAHENWKNDGKGEYSQISCFFSSDAGFDRNEAKGVKARLMEKLKESAVNPNGRQKLVPDAYSAMLGSFTVTGETGKRSEAEITASGGDFFLFRGFELVSGAFFSEDDLMQDGVVIDRQLAWNIYGTDNIAGKSIYINGIKLYISGVIEAPRTDPEERCVGSTPRAYISYYAAGLILGGGDGYDDLNEDTGITSDFREITCYECISPEPVENFTYNFMKKDLSELYKGKISIVNNTERFESKPRIKALKRLDDSVVRKDGIVLPFWENASRMVEFKLSFIYGGRRLLLAIPLITLLWLITVAYRAFMRKKDRLGKAVGGFVSAKTAELRKKRSDSAKENKESSEKEKQEQTKESKNKK
ncbi:ABC transporter permease [Ruminococcus sp.]|uniref:ABC transporter permease n=1 Tax=Ruminococcus sp. TaxID=41978 RepID=UPI0025E2E1D8|nr:ABC transporter permease [Ruminococcus sp.]MCR4637744.1 ABC transporter permease [Ruminococcus sp.]